jgi:hypothetical protein
VRGTDTFYQVKPSTGQISRADIIYIEFALPILKTFGESLNGNIVFQSILHGITRDHHADTPQSAAVLCGTAIVLAYTRGVLTHDDAIPYLNGGLEDLKNELESRKQTVIMRVAHKLSYLLVSPTLWERALDRIGIVQQKRTWEIDSLTREINTLLSMWG